MTVERWMTNEWNRYCKGKGASGELVLLADKDLFDAFEAGIQAMTREGAEPLGPRPGGLAFKSGRMYKLDRAGWRLVIEGRHGRQVGEYEAQS